MKNYLDKNQHPSFQSNTNNFNVDANEQFKNEPTSVLHVSHQETKSTQNQYEMNQLLPNPIFMQRPTEFNPKITTSFSLQSLSPSCSFSGSSSATSLSSINNIFSPTPTNKNVSATEDVFFQIPSTIEKINNNKNTNDCNNNNENNYITTRRNANMQPNKNKIDVKNNGNSQKCSD